ncbi:MAG: hypothetical protein ABI809_04720 [Caldimonas sp.]
MRPTPCRGLVRQGAHRRSGEMGSAAILLTRNFDDFAIRRQACDTGLEREVEGPETQPGARNRDASQEESRQAPIPGRQLSADVDMQRRPYQTPRPATSGALSTALRTRGFEVDDFKVEEEASSEISQLLGVAGGTLKVRCFSTGEERLYSTGSGSAWLGAFLMDLGRGHFARARHEAAQLPALSSIASLAARPGRSATFRRLSGRAAESGRPARRGLCASL